MAKSYKKPETKPTETKKEKVYPKGIIIFKPHEKAPDFVKGTMVINPDELFKFITENPDFVHDTEKYGEQLRLNILEGEKGLYLTVDTFKKD